MASSPSDESRSYLGKYQVVKHIATGGMGAVYQAVDTDSGREVALKVLAPDLAARPVMRERLYREAKHGGKLTHENIVALYEFGEAHGTYFVAMEYVPGVDLFDYISRNGPLSPDAARILCTQLATALAHIHQLGFVHRDIKPSNILLTRKEGRTVAKIADLGLSRDIGDEEYRLTREGQAVGTVDYLSPEQARDSGLADIRSDIYSLGCTLYHMLTGFPPFPDGNLTERLLKHAQVEAPDVRNFDPKIPAGLAAICRRMLAKKPEDRYQTPTELLADLQALDSMTASEEGKRSARRPGQTPEPATTVPEEKPRKPTAADGARVSEGQLELAKKALAAGDRRYALMLLWTSCRLDPANIACREALREAYEPESAHPGWQARLSTLYHAARARLARLLNKPEQILYHGERAVVLQPKNLTLHLQLAEAAVGARHWTLAKWFLAQAYRYYPDHIMIHRARALLLERRDEVKLAMAAWEQVDKSDPGNPEARDHLRNLAAREALTRGRYKGRLDEPTSTEA